MVTRCPLYGIGDSSADGAKCMHPVPSQPGLAPGVNGAPTPQKMKKKLQKKLLGACLTCACLKALHAPVNARPEWFWKRRDNFASLLSARCVPFHDKRGKLSESHPSVFIWAAGVQLNCLILRDDWRWFLRRKRHQRQWHIKVKAMANQGKAHSLHLLIDGEFSAFASSIRIKSIVWTNQHPSYYQ